MKDIKEVCHSRGYKIKDIADKLGMSPCNLATLMRRNPTLQLLQRVADALGITVSELVKD